MAAVSQLVQRAQIFHREPGPTLRVTRRPQIAGNASGKTLAVIVDLNQLLSAVMAAIHAATFVASCATQTSPSSRWTAAKGQPAWRFIVSGQFAGKSFWSLIYVRHVAADALRTGLPLRAECHPSVVHKLQVMHLVTRWPRLWISTSSCSQLWPRSVA